MSTTSTVEQNHTVAWGIIVVMVAILVALWVGIWFMATPIAGL